MIKLQDLLESRRSPLAKDLAFVRALEREADAYGGVGSRPMEATGQHVGAQQARHKHGAPGLSHPALVETSRADSAERWASNPPISADLIKACGDVKALSLLVRRETVSDLRMVPTTAALVRLAKLREVGNRSKRKGGRQGAGAVEATATAEDETLALDLLALILPRVMEVAWEMDAQGAGSCLWALSKLPLIVKPLPEEQPVQKLPAVAPSATQSASSSTTLPVVKELVSVAGRVASSMDGVNISNSLYAIAVIDMRSREQHREQRHEAGSSGKEEKWLGGSSLRRGCGGLVEDLDPAAMQLLLAATSEKMYALGPQALSNIAWSLARLGVRPNGTWTAAFLGHSEAALHLMLPRELASLAWALLRLGAHPDSRWGKYMFKASLKSLHR